MEQKKGKNSVSILLIPFKRVYATILLSTVFVSCFHAYPVNGTCILKILEYLFIYGVDLDNHSKEKY
ncbi:hypothetical protein BLOT_010719 [Blomia tropicalis]|nr:hypothetical protein BLOT_010719 [Blomia tropicalis]